MRLMKNYLSLLNPRLLFLVCTCNENDTDVGIEAMGKRLVTKSK
jgi:hypothetical protein